MNTEVDMEVWRASCNVKIVNLVKEVNKRMEWITSGVYLCATAACISMACTVACLALVVFK